MVKLWYTNSGFYSSEGRKIMVSPRGSEPPIQVDERPTTCEHGCEAEITKMDFPGTNISATIFCCEGCGQRYYQPPEILCTKPPNGIVRGMSVRLIAELPGIPTDRSLIVTKSHVGKPGRRKGNDKIRKSHPH